MFFVISPCILSLVLHQLCFNHQPYSILVKYVEITKSEERQHTDGWKKYNQGQPDQYFVFHIYLRQPFLILQFGLWFLFCCWLVINI